MTVQFIHKNCNPDMANDRTLPYTAYLVEYVCDGDLTYDIVSSQKRVEIFDYYWDKYREDLKSFKQTEGMVNPKLWGQKPKEEKRKK